MTHPRRHVYRAADVELEVGGTKFPSVDVGRIDIEPPLPASLLVVRAFPEFGVAERVADLIRRRFRLGPAWPLGAIFASVQQQSDAQSVTIVLVARIQERTTGRPQEIRFGRELPVHLGDDFVLQKLADHLEAMVLHEARESFFVDGALLRDPHANEFTLRLKDLDHLLGNKE